ncbi:MAG: LysR family transcriptional regulator, partial [Gloeobacteraceae cyanobacterium ES-bin-144]|nr:LysR family transcriptional regulator [Verrucomicrobiales bacterium]
MKETLLTEFLNYHHLRYFWTVAKTGSLRMASEKLKVSQPSMCTQIKLLEASLGESLFRPSGRSLELTEFGQLIYGYAEEIFALGSEILRATKQAPGTRALRLHVGIVDSFPKLMSYDILRPVLEHQPQVELTCHEGKLADLVS